MILWRKIRRVFKGVNLNRELMQKCVSEEYPGEILVLTYNSKVLGCIILHTQCHTEISTISLQNGRRN